MALPREEVFNTFFLVEIYGIEENLKKIPDEPAVGEALNCEHLASPTIVSSVTMQLRYAKMPLALSPKEVISQLKARLPVSNYLVAREEHKVENQAIHLVLILLEKKDLGNPHAFDVEFEGNTYGCNVKGVRFLKSVIDDLSMQGEFTTDMNLSQENGQMALKRLMLAFKDSAAMDDTLLQYLEGTPELVLSCNIATIEKILKFLRDAAKLKKKSINELRQAMESPFSLLYSSGKKLTSPNDWTENGF